MDVCTRSARIIFDFGMLAADLSGCILASTIGQARGVIDVYLSRLLLSRFLKAAH
jgi:hypothetical protein